jgi:cobalt-zinc-cadmium efflux system protein
MQHRHSHHHPHADGHHQPDFGRAFAIGIALNVAFVAIEALYGVHAHSLALLADAGHNLSDVLGLALAWGATALVRRSPTRRRTYGLLRTSILASLFNAQLLLIAICGIAWEAFARLRHPEPVASGVVMGVAAAGFIVNAGTAWLFRSGRTDLNIRSAFVHMSADAAVSLGVVVAALVMGVTGWLWLDPAVSLVIVAVIGVGTWGVLRDSVNLVLDAVPQGIDPDDVERHLAGLPTVQAVHDLHIWAMSTTDIALTVHLVTPDASTNDALLSRINDELLRIFRIGHCTVQFERGDAAHPCGQASGDCV